MENLCEIIESILFVAGEAVTVSDISGKLDVTAKEMNKAIDQLKNRFSGESGIVLLHFNDKLQLATNSKYAEAVSTVLNPIRERNLSKATLETAAIIAYKQPITRLEIEEIRGVSCDYAINILMEHNLIEVVGRKDAVGRPVLFGTTDEFLKRFNISSIADLPDYNALLEKVKIVRTNSDSLYNKYDVPTDPIVADSILEEQGENNNFKEDENKGNENEVEEASVETLSNKTQKERVDENLESANLNIENSSTENTKKTVTEKNSTKNTDKTETEKNLIKTATNHDNEDLDLLGDINFTSDDEML